MCLALVLPDSGLVNTQIITQIRCTIPPVVTKERSFPARRLDNSPSLQRSLGLSTFEEFRREEASFSAPIGGSAPAGCRCEPFHFAQQVFRVLFRMRGLLITFVGFSIGGTWPAPGGFRAAPDRVDASSQCALAEGFGSSGARFALKTPFVSHQDGKRMAQNIYDNPDFFAGYSQLPLSFSRKEARDFH